MRIRVANRVAWCFGSDHPDVQVSTGHHLVVVNVKAVREYKRSALLDIGLNVVFVDGCDIFIRQQDHHNVRSLDRVVHFHHIQTSFANFVPGRATLAQTHNHFHAAVVQVLGMGMTLATVADDGHCLTFDQAQVAVFVVINFHFSLR